MAFAIYQLSIIILPLLAVMFLQAFGEEASCFGALGMEDGTIKDPQITVSSVFRTSNSGTSARLRKTLNNWGAWCPNITNAVKMSRYDKYIQIDLLDLISIRKVATQGREAHTGEGDEFTETYQISYSRDDKSWLHYEGKDNSETKVFSGNTDVKTVVENKIDPPIIARYVRIHPGYTRAKQPCLRLELYGCPWNEQGILSYTMPEGQVTKNGKSKYKDINYTGTRSGGMLYNGTGLLTDGEIGPADSKLYDGKGWVGWNQNFTGQHGVNITFEFDFLRIFSSVTITVSNNKERNFLFNKSQIFLGEREDDFSLSSALQYYCPEEIQPNGVMENVNVTLSLCGNVGKFVRIQLYHGGRWLLISEIKFNSVKAINDKTIFQTCSFDSEHGPCKFLNSSLISTQSLATPSPTATTGFPCTESSSAHLMYILIALVCVFCVIGLVVIVLLLTRRKSTLSKRSQEVFLEMRTPSLNVDNNDDNDVLEAPASSNQIPNNEENQAEANIDEGYEYPDNVGPDHPGYTSLMERTEEEDNYYKDLIK